MTGSRDADDGPETRPAPELAELAELSGVSTEFWDWRGRHRAPSAATVIAVLRALGVDASSPAATAVALADRRDASWRQTLPACVVAREGQPLPIRVHVPHGHAVEVWVVTEAGERWQLAQLDRYVDPRPVDGALVGEATFECPGDIPLGWHVLMARVGAGDATTQASATLVMTPAYVGFPPSMDGGGPVWGFMTQLYSVRSRQSWGHGDLADLGELARWSGELGAGFVLVNPLHAASPVAPIEPSPYLPVTRRFISPLYLRVEAVPEVAELGPADRAQIDALSRQASSANATDALLDRDAVWAAKRSALEKLHAVPRGAARQGAYDTFREREGQGLVDFATWCALGETHGPNWREWPDELQRAHGPEVSAARSELAPRVDFFCWLQWLADEQLEAAQGRAVGAGMPLGIVHDLAVGVHRNGADTWALGDVLAQGVTVGAPPDAFNQQGQDWSQPPWRPDRLAAAGYAPYRDLLRTILRHAGGIRVDHVMGLFRLWWVPEGSSPVHGTYVRFDREAMVGILALEARRAGALVIGEDLGTVEPGVRDFLSERGILGTSILWFEADDQGAPLQPEHWRELALTSVTTHDLPPTRGFIEGEHVRLRHELGLLATTYEEELAAAERDLAAWRALLEGRGLLRPGAGADEVVVALHRLIAQTPARLLCISLADAVGDKRAQNQPGTDQEYPNWRVPLTDGAGSPVLVEDLPGNPLLRRIVKAVTG